MVVSYKLRVWPANKNKEQQMTQMGWIRLYTTQDAHSLIQLKSEDAHC
jgi:hypothetical protein